MCRAEDHHQAETLLKRPQVLEQAAEMCCGSRDALVSQFKEAGAHHPALSPMTPNACSSSPHAYKSAARGMREGGLNVQGLWEHLQ